jgi:hypothetical protein
MPAIMSLMGHASPEMTCAMPAGVADGAHRA